MTFKKLKPVSFMIMSRLEILGDDPSQLAKELVNPVIS